MSGEVPVTAGEVPVTAGKRRLWIGLCFAGLAGLVVIIVPAVLFAKPQVHHSSPALNLIGPTSGLTHDPTTAVPTTQAPQPTEKVRDRGFHITPRPNDPTEPTEPTGPAETDPTTASPFTQTTPQPVGKCLQEAFLCQSLLGCFIPKCQPDGSYAPVQCQDNQCWCVDPMGQEVMGTRVAGTIDATACPAPMPSIPPVRSYCQILRDAQILACQASSSLCWIATCDANGDFSSRQCVGNVCWCVDSLATEIPDTRGGDITCETVVLDTPCQRVRDAQMMNCPAIGCNLVACTPDGRYSPRQCGAGWCWCVDPSGVEINNTRIAAEFSTPDSCNMYMTGTRCEVRALSERSACGGMTGCTTTQCLPDGSFAPVQCSGSTGACWCVDQLGVPFGPRVVGAEPTCKPATCAQPILTGPCRARFVRYAYNGSSCEQFVYGGCQGNDNNFDSLDSCRQACPGA